MKHKPLSSTSNLEVPSSWPSALLVLGSEFETGRTSLIELELPSDSGLYVVLDGDEPVYVGMSRNMAKRWQNHDLLHRDGFETANANVFWARMPLPVASFWEVSLIEHLRPRFNTQYKVMPVCRKPLTKLSAQERAERRSKTAAFERRIASILADALNQTPDGANKDRIAKISGRPTQTVAKYAAGILPMPLDILTALAIVSKPHGQAIYDATVAEIEKRASAALEKERTA